MGPWGLGLDWWTTPYHPAVAFATARRVWPDQGIIGGPIHKELGMSTSRIWLRRSLFVLLGLVILLPLLLAVALVALGIPSFASGMAAKGVCSAVFVAGRSAQGLLEQEVLPADPVLTPVGVSIDQAQRSATGRYLGMAPRRAVWLPDRGCVLDLDPAPPAAIAGSAVGSRSLPDAGKPWPEGNAALPAASWGADVDSARLQKTIADAFVGAGDVDRANTRGVAVLHKGRLLVLRQAEGFGPDTPLHGWSMAKTVGAMLMHKLAADGGLALDTPVVDAFVKGREPAWLAAWRLDGRKAIRLSDLMFMRDGLASTENYNPWGAVPKMLWGVNDAAAFGAAAALEAAPGQRWRYLSTSANLMAALARGRMQNDALYWAYPRQALFEPIGAHSAVLETDVSGNWLASSFVWASSADWARIGELLRNDGRWGGKQVLPPGFLKLALTPASATGAGKAYGAQTWLIGEPTHGECKGQGLPEDTIAMEGHWGQLVAVIPSREAVVVRLGWTFKRGQFNACKFVAEVLAALPK
jgi:CubicO group peptidase (beta-lactamase class C family)